MDAAVGAREAAFLFCHVRACVKTKTVLVLSGDLEYVLHTTGNERWLFIWVYSLKILLNFKLTHLISWIRRSRGSCSTWSCKCPVAKLEERFQANVHTLLKQLRWWVCQSGWMVLSCVSAFSWRILTSVYLQICLGLKKITDFECQFSKMDFMGWSFWLSALLVRLEICWNKLKVLTSTKLGNVLVE